MNEENEQLKTRIAELEKELDNREKDLRMYRNELIQTNHAIESLIEQMTQELKLAALIQKILSPTEMPHISGVEISSKFVPGSRFGGDYFDIFEHEDKYRFGVVLSSANGYAMSAIFLGILIKLGHQMEARRGLEPHKVIETIAHELSPNAQSKDFANIFYAVIDRRSFEFNYCSAGKMGVFLQRANSDEVTTFSSQNPAITQGWNLQLQTQKISLNPLDRLIFVTEGVLQTQNPEGEVFGEERVLESILKAPKAGVHELRNEIMFQIERFAEKNQGPIRDQTVLVLEVKDRVIKLAKG
jgi:sigma-B regulation protein RsbU (phosphoserine phosphatase)